MWILGRSETDGITGAVYRSVLAICRRQSQGAQLLADARALKRHWRASREETFRGWTVMVTDEEEEALVDLLVALELGEQRH